jgi:hypothetical protein
MKPVTYKEEKKIDRRNSVPSSKGEKKDFCGSYLADMARHRIFITVSAEIEGYILYQGRKSLDHEKRQFNGGGGLFVSLIRVYDSKT